MREPRGSDHLPMVEARVFTDPPDMRDEYDVIPRFRDANLGQVLGSQAVELTAEEANAVLALRNEVAPLYDSEAIRLAQEKTNARRLLRGLHAKDLPPSFGTHTHTREDGDTITYVMQLHGKAAPSAIGSLDSGRRAPVAFKIGRSHDPRARLKQLNFAFPSLDNLRWELKYQFQHPTVALARDMEQTVLIELNAYRRRDAGTDEIVVCTEAELLPVWTVAIRTAAARRILERPTPAHPAADN